MWLLDLSDFSRFSFGRFSILEDGGLVFTIELGQHLIPVTVYRHYKKCQKIRRSAMAASLTPKTSPCQ